MRLHKSWRVVGFFGLTLSVAAAGGAQPVTEQAAYQGACAECHGTRLQGGAHGPALTGVSFSSVWGGRSADDLFDYVRREMPPGQGGSLRDESYRSIVALIRQSNDPISVASVEPSLAPDAETAEPDGRTTRFGSRELAELTPVTDALLTARGESRSSTFM